MESPQQEYEQILYEILVCEKHLKHLDDTKKEVSEKLKRFKQEERELLKKINKIEK